jgi:hypothetical protein
MLENYCPLWDMNNICSDFCDGCNFIDGECYLQCEKEEMFATSERLKIGI